MLGCYHSNIINEYLFNMAGETEDKISMPFENSPEKAGSFTGLVAGLKYCLEQISVNKELRDKWNELLTPGTDF